MNQLTRADVAHDVGQLSGAYDETKTKLKQYQNKTKT